MNESQWGSISAFMCKNIIIQFSKNSRLLDDLREIVVFLARYLDVNFITPAFHTIYHMLNWLNSGGYNKYFFPSNIGMSFWYCIFLSNYSNFVTLLRKKCSLVSIIHSVFSGWIMLFWNGPNGSHWMASKKNHRLSKVDFKEKNLK